MNKARRKRLDELLQALEGLQNDLGVSKDEEQEYYDNMPESFQNGEKGEAATECVDALESAEQSIEDACDYLRQVIQS